jgi:fructoselysine-6-P-deglycase FrlB-like protein
MSEEISKTVTVCVSLNQFAKAVMAACAMIEAAVEQYDDTATRFNEGLLALGNEMKTHVDYIYTVAIKSSETVLLTTKIRIKSEIDKLDSLIDAYEQVQKKQSSKKKGANNEE